MENELYMYPNWKNGGKFIFVIIMFLTLLFDTEKTKLKCALKVKTLYFHILIY